MHGAATKPTTSPISSAPSRHRAAAGSAHRPAGTLQLPQPEHRRREGEQHDHDDSDHQRVLQRGAEELTGERGRDAEHRVGHRHPQHVDTARARRCRRSALRLLREEADRDRDQRVDAGREVEREAGDEHRARGAAAAGPQPATGPSAAVAVTCGAGVGPEKSSWLTGTGCPPGEPPRPPPTATTGTGGRHCRSLHACAVTVAPSSVAADRSGRYPDRWQPRSPPALPDLDRRAPAKSNWSRVRPARVAEPPAPSTLGEPATHGGR